MILPLGNKAVRTTSRSSEAIAGLNALFEPYEHLDDLLHVAARVIVESLAVQRCVVTWLGDDHVTLWVRAKHSRASVSALGANANGQSRVSTESATHVIREALFNPQALASNGTAVSSQLSAPLHVNRQIIGYVCVSNGRNAQRHAQIDAELFLALSAHLGHAIEHLQMRQLLASRYMFAAVGRAQQAESAGAATLDACVLQSVQNPEKVARIIARSFYKDLRKAGFVTQQILLVASEIIGHLNEAFTKTNAKTE